MCLFSFFYSYRKNSQCFCIYIVVESATSGCRARKYKTSPFSPPGTVITILLLPLGTITTAKSLGFGADGCEVGVLLNVEDLTRLMQSVHIHRLKRNDTRFKTTSVQETMALSGSSTQFDVVNCFPEKRSKYIQENWLNPVAEGYVERVG